MKRRIFGWLLAAVMVLGLVPALPAASAVSITLQNSSDYICFYRTERNRLDIQGKDNGKTLTTTYHDGGYQTEISVDGGSRVQVPFQLGPVSVGSSLRVWMEPELVAGGRYVRINYLVENQGSVTRSFQIGSSADIEIADNDRAEITRNGNTLAMYSGSATDYWFYLVAPSCDTLWYGHYYSAAANLFSDQPESSGTYSGDSGAAWSWRGQVEPGEIWTDYVLIGAGEVEAMEWACGAGLVNGIGSGQLAPGGTATRAQAACILQRFAQQ